MCLLSETTDKSRKREIYMKLCIVGNKLVSDDDIISCLATCETVISKNAYLEKKWRNSQIFEGVTNADQYTEVRVEWMGYREKLRDLLQKLYPMSMKEIIQHTKSCKDKATQKHVKEMVSLME